MNDYTVESGLIEPDYTKAGYYAFWDIVCRCLHGRTCPVSMQAHSNQPEGKVYSQK